MLSCGLRFIGVQGCRLSISRRMSPKSGQYCFQNRQHLTCTLCPDHPVPERFELFPSTGISHMPPALKPVLFNPRTAKNRRPAIEIPICAPVTFYQRLGRHPRWMKNDVTRVEQVPIVAGHTSLCLHSLIEGRARIWREDMKGCRLDSLLDRPLDCPIKDRLVVIIHAEYETAVDHDTQ